MTKFWSVFLTLLFSLATVSTVSAASRFIGINTNEAMHIDASVPFVDLFRVSQPFDESPPHLTKGNVTYDANGWVKDLNGGQAGTYFVRWMPADAMPEGEYIVRYDGEGVISYADSAKRIDHKPGRDVITLEPNAKDEISASLAIRQSNPNNPVRNIRVLMPGGICESNPYKHVESAGDCSGNYLSFEEHSKRIVFNPAYLNFMKDFKTIRFMNMSGITRNPISQWSERPNMQEATWAGKEGKRGVPLEIMVRLANQLNADAWFNLPHRANDNFVRQHAQYVRDNLKPNLKAYVEYSNETWNTVFKQTHHVREQGLKLGLDKDKQAAGYKYHSQRSKEIFQIWEQVFGGTTRLKRVLSGWSGNPGITPSLLKHADVYKHTDVFAIAPYFYASQSDMMGAQSSDEIFRLINNKSQRYSISKTIEQIKKHAELVKPYGVKLVAYEGGQHLVHYKTRSVSHHPNPILIEANRDDRMELAYTELLNSFRGAGGQLFIAFSAPRANAHWGFWGLKEHINQSNSEAPKYRAVMKF